MALALAGPPASASTAPQSAPSAVLEAAPHLQAAGSGRLHWFGLLVYEARLWVEPGFRASQPGRHALALELVYRRAFRAADIARRSLAEMERAAPVPPEQAARWTAQLQRVLPDVQAGDRITGLHLPGRGAAFFFNGKPTAAINDKAFARLFFGIWLSPKTSAPGLRNALIGKA